jgi:hypothetical protein
MLIRRFGEIGCFAAVPGVVVPLLADHNQIIAVSIKLELRAPVLSLSKSRLLLLIKHAGFQH